MHQMFSPLAVTLLLAACVPGAAVKPRPAPASSSPPTNTVVYDCGEYRFTTRVGQDSAWLFLPERTVTLPHVVAASGAKYSDSGVTYWSKGEQAILEMDGTARRECGIDRQWEEAKLRGVGFRAVGDEPGWWLEIEPGKRILFLTDY